MPADVVKVCDHLRPLPGGKPKNEVRGEAIGIAIDRLIQSLGCDALEYPQISIEQYALSPQYNHAARNGLDSKQCWTSTD